jgi:hypothetical protein
LKARFVGKTGAALSSEFIKPASSAVQNSPLFEMPTGESEVQSTSLDGRYCVRVLPWEARNTLWVFSPCIVDTQRRICVFRFAEACWSVDQSNWLRDTAVELNLRKFPGDRTGAGIRVVVDCERGIGRLEGGNEVGLSALEAELEIRIEREV